MACGAWRVVGGGCGVVGWGGSGVVRRWRRVEVEGGVVRRSGRGAVVNKSRLHQLRIHVLVNLVLRGLAGQLVVQICTCSELASQILKGAMRGVD